MEYYHNYVYTHALREIFNEGSMLNIPLPFLAHSGLYALLEEYRKNIFASCRNDRELDKLVLNKVLKTKSEIDVIIKYARKQLKK